MKRLKNITISEYDYSLPPERIAQFPLAERDKSKLLYYKNGNIKEEVFENIADFLPEKCLLIFNETKVIQARLIFQKETGARIEIFCLEPVEPSSEIQLAFQQRSYSVWKCFIGNSKRWKKGQLQKSFEFNNKKCLLTAERKEQEQSVSLVEFKWEPADLTFSEILELSGLVPLPPYLNRKAVESDKFRYQTVYAKNNGSVAAPTAGFHFTDKVFKKLISKNIQFDKLTLHVGAGTFKPVIAETIQQHEMHYEKMLVKKSTIKKLLENNEKKIISVGTTTTRTLESLYWFGIKLIVENSPLVEFTIRQWDPYLEKYNKHISTRDSLLAVLNYMNNSGIEILTGFTQLMIVPGYDFKIIDGIITNFHQPKSTLLLLIAAFIGDDWKKAYDFALANNFRFLSYGDSCLFLKSMRQ